MPNQEREFLGSDGDKFGLVHSFSCFIFCARKVLLKHTIDQRFDSMRCNGCVPGPNTFNSFKISPFGCAAQTARSLNPLLFEDLFFGPEFQKKIKMQKELLAMTTSKFLTFRDSLVYL